MDYMSLEFDSPNPVVINENVSKPTIPTKPQTTQPPNRFIILSSLCGVFGLLTIIALILSILAFLHQPSSVFTPASIENLDTIAANVTIVDTNVQASGFQDGANIFSAIGDALKCATLNAGNIISDTMETNTLTTSILVAPTLQINELKTNLIQLNSSQSSSVFKPTSIVYSDTVSTQTNTFEANSIVLFNESTNESTTITPNSITFQLNAGKIKNLVSLRYQAFNLTESTNFLPPGVAVLLLPTSGGIQSGSLIIPPQDLKLGSTFRITAHGTYQNFAVSDSKATFSIANTQNKTNNQPSQVILGVYPEGIDVLGSSAGSWIHTIEFSINDIKTPATTSIQAFGKMTLKKPGSITQTVFNHTNTNINTQQGLQLTVWGTWNETANVLVLNQLYVEQLF